MSTPALAVGQIISGNYRILGWVGAGGMGEIYEAAHTRLSGRYAIKVLRPEIAATSDAFARFQREARVTSALQHPNIVQVVDFSASDVGAPYLVMEFLDGPELAQLMKRSGPLPLSKVTSYVKQIASGLMAAHESDVVHRDLKPQNIFVLDVIGHEEELIKIVDFGISKVTDASAITAPLGIMGTARYMSPEQARGQVDEIDARTDQFSLAVITYEMLTGQNAFTGSSISSLLYQIVHEEPRALVDPASTIPPAVASVLKRALAKNKEQRFSTVKAFAIALEEATAAGSNATSVAMASKGGGSAGVRPEWSSRRRLWLGTGFAALTVTGLWLLRHEPARTIDIRSQSVLSNPFRETRPVAVPPKPVPPALRGPEGVIPAAIPVGTKRDSTKRDSTMMNRRLKPEPGRPPSATPSPQQTNCNPSYSFDSRGDKHFKPECFLNQPGVR